MKRPRSTRLRRIDEAMRESIADEVARLKDPRIGFVTITGVETSPDLRHATIYYTVLGTPEEQAESAAGLSHAAPHIQGRIGAYIRIKYTPRLEFRLDSSVETGLRIDALLRNLNEPSTQTQPRQSS